MPGEWDGAAIMNKWILGAILLAFALGMYAAVILKFS